MRLTAYTDYTLRTLIHLAGQPGRLVTIQDIASQHGISKNHLMKVVYQLGLTGLVQTVRGRNGGLRLAKAPEDISVGAVVRHTENDFYMAACFDAAREVCPYASCCGLKGLLGQATAAYLGVLDRATLADLVAMPGGGGGLGLGQGGGVPMQLLQRLDVTTSSFG
ncbi:Rrf2 family transcriptional regulator [Duganella sp. LX20W]|uniref:Rrf2 family transcriptional regulator n=1 Tax=Rugamonas brunnea TaxID=2758569 RepID=A0A7W2ETQ0_9BURK|nr:Rrf2 family transcriptional regulator [Rugamonas brunnea]MBA5638417.1 Rrf2 family transcriptional regulator [Rugamonas brunnea]